MTEEALDLVWLVCMLATVAFGIMALDVVMQRAIRSRGQLYVLAISAAAAVCSAIILVANG